MQLKFVFIVLCFALALGSYFFCKSKRDWAFLSLGMLFTVIADFFLVMQNNHLPGVATFCFAHIFYIIRGGQFATPKWKRTIYVMLPLAVVAIAAFAWASVLLAVAGLYALLFISNIIINTKFCKVNRHLMLSGLILFALCDVNVLLFNIPQHFDTVIDFSWAFVFIWVFYVPSQLLIAVSGVKFRN